MNTSKKQAYAVILSTFVLGALTGALGLNLFKSSAFSNNSRAPRPAMIETLATELKLTEQQRVEVQKVLDETKQQFDEMGKQVRPQFQQIRDDSRTKIKALLTPEQQTLFDEWDRKREARREQMRHEHDGRDKAK